MNIERIKKDEFLTNLPPDWPVDLLPEIQAQVKASGRKVVVLDDDPTGTQTVHNIPVLTEWPVELLTAEFKTHYPAFYLLTNSRALPAAKAEALNNEIGQNLINAARQAGQDFVVVSRSDSTLRGHFPGEVEALVETLGQEFDGWIVLPYFLEGGRYTVGDIHYVAEDEWLVPAGQTEFARDKAFGYKASNLRHWVEEKMGGRVPAQDVTSISIEDIRQGGPRQVAERLVGLGGDTICVVNAASYRDLEVFALGLLTAEAQGKHFLYRTASSFVRVRAGLGSRPLLTPAELNLPSTGGGLIVVGSYVPRSTGQVHRLLQLPHLTRLEIEVAALLDDNRFHAEVERVATAASQSLQNGQDVAIYTGRTLITGPDAQSSLAIGQRVSAGVVAIVQAIQARPRYLLAKGGITSSDVATRGLGIKRAIVPGQILPGVPVWQAGAESRYPGLTYIVFPGNVGGPEAIAQVVTMMKGSKNAGTNR
jgi:uncharacterized protein YgbK (DUF1537 family)